MLRRGKLVPLASLVVLCHGRRSTTSPAVRLSVQCPVVAAQLHSHNISTQFRHYSSSEQQQGQQKQQLTFFSVFGLQPSVDIDPIELKKVYYDKMRHLHPDVQSSAEASQQKQQKKDEEEGGDVSSFFVAAAYHTLKDPFQRARYLHQLLKLGAETLHEGVGGTIVEDAHLSKARQRSAAADDELRQRLDKSDETMSAAFAGHHQEQEVTNEDDGDLPEDFYQEMMALNEQLFSLDESSPESELYELEKTILQKDLECWELARERWAAVEATSKDDDRAASVASFGDCVRRWTYVANLKKHLQDFK